MPVLLALFGFAERVDVAEHAQDAPALHRLGREGIDVQPPVDVYRNDCPDADSLLVYTITDSNQLQSFNPASGTFTTIANISSTSRGQSRKAA